MFRANKEWIFLIRKGQMAISILFYTQMILIHNLIKLYLVVKANLSKSKVEQDHPQLVFRRCKKSTVYFNIFKLVNK